MRNKSKKEINNWIISEVSFFAFLYYAQYLLGVDGSLLFSTFILWALLNLTIVFCPVMKECYKK